MTLLPALEALTSCLAFEEDYPRDFFPALEALTSCLAFEEDYPRGVFGLLPVLKALTADLERPRILAELP